MTSDLRSDLCDHWLHQSSRFHSEHTSGELFSRMVSDIDKMQSAVSNQLLDLIQQSVTLLVLIALLFSTHFKLAAICLVAAPAIVYPIYRIGRGMRQTSHRSQERMAELSSLLTEMVRGHRIVKAFGMEEFELARFRHATDRHLRVNLRAQVLSSFSTPVVEIVSSFGGCLLLIYAASLVRAGQLTTPLLIQFFIQPAAALRSDPAPQQGEPGAAGRRRGGAAGVPDAGDPQRDRRPPARAAARDGRAAGCASSRCASAIAAMATTCSRTSASSSRPAR